MTIDFNDAPAQSEPEQAEHNDTGSVLRVMGQLLPIHDGNGYVPQEATEASTKLLKDALVYAYMCGWSRQEVIDCMDSFGLEQWSE